MKIPRGLDRSFRATFGVVVLSVLFYGCEGESTSHRGKNARGGAPGLGGSATGAGPAGGASGAATSGGASGSDGTSGGSGIGGTSGATTGGTGTDGGAGDGPGGNGEGGEGGGVCGTPTDPEHCGTCGHDCTKLPNVVANAMTCVDGQCSYGTGACLPGFGHCSADPDGGCLSDLTTDNRCGGCTTLCPYTAQLCASPPSEPPSCVTTCPSGTTRCSYQCVDLQSNAGHCSACNQRCALEGAYSRCENGECILAGCQANFLDCDASREGCETARGTFDNCSGCGDSCGAAHALGRCEDAQCTRECAPGYGNCTTSQPACETPLDTASNCGACGTRCPSDRPLCRNTGGVQTCVTACLPPAADQCGTGCVDLMSDAQHCGACGTACELYQGCEAGSCTPRYLGSEIFPGEGIAFTGVDALPNGSYAVLGRLEGSADLDPTAASDPRTSAGGWDVVVGKFNANGTRAWAHTIGGPEMDFDRGVSMAPDGSVVACLDFSGTVDFDPGAGVTQRTSMNGQPALVKFAANGSFAWVRTFAVSGASAQAEGGSVRSDSTGAVYLMGIFQGQIDLDPGAGTTEKSTSDLASYLVKLGADGNFAWGVAFQDCNAYLYDASVDANGILWAVGLFMGTCDLDPGPGSAPTTATQDQNGFLFRLDATSGATVGSPVRYDLYSLGPIVFDSDDSYYLGASTQNANTGLVLQTTASGSSGWTASFDDIGGFALAPARGGGVLVAGSGNRSPGPRHEGIFITKLNRSGEKTWLVNQPGPGSNVTSIDSSDQSFVAVGQLNGAPFDLDPGTTTTLVSPPGAFISRYAY